MYDIIYGYLTTYIFNGNVPQCSFDIGGVSIGLNEWLANTTCIAIMVLFVILGALLVRWVFRLVTSAFLLR